MATTKRLIVLGMVWLSLICTYYAEAQTVISAISTSTAAGTDSNASVTSPSDASNDITGNQAYTLQYGRGNDIFVDSYTVAGITYSNFLRPDTLVLNRRVTNDRLVNIWYTLITDPAGNTTLQMDPTAATDADAIYLTGTLNAGYDNILVNDDDLAAGSIQVETERVDVIWNQGIQTSSPTTAVFPVIERGGNDNVAIAAITSLNPDGTPASYGTLIGIPETFWPQTGSTFNNYLILRREIAGVEPIPLLNIGTFVGQGSQTVQGVAVSFSELGISANQNVFGYSLFSADVCNGFTSDSGDALSTGAQTIAPGIDLTDISTFPSDTKSNDSGLDLVAGVSAAVASDDNLVETKGPGGYKAALATWLKANDGAFVSNGGAASSEGSVVGFWEDQAIGNHDFVTLGTAPTFRSTTSSINFNPTVDFLDGSETGLQTPDNEDFNVIVGSNPGYENKSINIAFRTPNSVSSLNNKQQLFEQGGGTNGLGIYIRNSTLHMSVWNRGNQAQGDWNDSGTSAETVSVALNTNTEYIVTLEFEGDPASSGSGAIRGYLNGQQFGILTTPFGQNIGLLYNHGGDIGLGQHDGASLYDDNNVEGDSFYGEISEFIYCNEPSSFPIQQRNRIESYLAIKYGITLDQSTPLNYFNADGDIIFDATNNAAIGGFLEYNNDIAGIGRDDASELDQPASRSENTGSVVTIDRGATISTDDTWLIWGNDGGALTESAILTAPDTIDSRIERVWRASETNEVQTTSVSFDLTGLGLSTNPADYSLLIAGNSSNADFSNATVISGGVYDGPTNTITFSGVDIDDGEYFTLGTSFAICSPGGVESNLALWVLANKGTNTTTEGVEVTSWTDQGGSNTITGTGGTAPTYDEVNINFNPSLDFDGTELLEGSSGLNSAAYYLVLSPDNNLSSTSGLSFPIGYDVSSAAVTNNIGGLAFGNLSAGFTDEVVTHLVGFNSTSYVRGEQNNAKTLSQNIPLMFTLRDDAASATETTISQNGERIDDTDYQGSTIISFTNEEFELGRLEQPNDITGTSFFFDGKIAELISYSSRPTDAENDRIETYLAIKYGITLDQTSARNYIASDGSTVIFDATNNEGAGGSLNFNNDIAGIGRDDTSCLEQKQSTSQNAGSIVTMGLGSIEASNTANSNSFTSDLDFLVWGNDGDFADQGNANSADVPGIVTERMERIWRVEENGTVGNTTIQFDLTGLGYSSNVSDFSLIISSSTTMASGTTVPAASLVNNILTFNNVDLTDGQFFTIGTARTSCGPGGVQTSIQVWLRADAGTNTTTNGADITTWTDQTGNGNDATATNAPEYIEVNNNFNPALNFINSNSDVMSIADGSNDSPDQQAVFVVGAIDTDNSASWAPFVMKTASFDWPNGWGIARNNATSNTYYHKDNFTSNNSGTDYAEVTITDDVTALHMAYKDASTYFYSLNNGTPDSDTPGSTYQSSDNVTFIGASPSGTGTTNNTTPTAFLDGSISEIIMFSDDLTSAERERVASYLAIKYGITQDNAGGGTAGDYLRADGTNIWDADFNDGINGAGAYHNDVAGIGRDDDGCFSQKQSSSINSDDILSVGLGSIAASNASNINSFDDSGDYFVWGNDNGSTSSASPESVDVPATIAQRMTRIWRAEDNGLVGNTELQFDLNSTGYQTVDASAYSLLVSDSEDMASATIITGGTINGGILSFSGIDITDGQYFTIGTQFTTCGPGGVNTNISVWFRADEEAYSDLGTTLANDGENILQWGDQSSPTIDALEQDLGGGASAIEPTFETNEFNFNPVARFTDPNSNNSSYFQTASTAVTGDFTLISIFKTGQAQGTDEDALNSPTLISARNAGSADYSMGMQGGTLWLEADSDDGFEVQTTGTYNNNQIHIATSVKSGTGLNLYVDSENVASGTGSATLGSATGYGIGNHFNSDLQAQFAGDIAETIVFSSALSETEQARVESYLAIKYGLTRSVSGLSEAAEDYLAADGDIVWNVDLQGTTYYNDIFGIARDDLSCFNQVQSQSESDDALVTFNIPGGFVDNDAYLLSGNDNAPIEEANNPEVPTSLGINSRLNREWRVQETGNVGTIQLTYDMATITGPLGVGTNNLGLLRLLVDDDGDFSNGGTVAISPSSFNGSDNTVTFDVDFTNGQYYTLGSEERAALPVELLSFEAEAQEEIVLLNWATISEINNAFFSIERSANGIDFETIANVDGAGNSQGVINYRYLDRNPLDGFSFYRLKQTDFSGEFDYSEVRSVYVERSDEIKLDLYPNPIQLGEVLKLSHNFRESQRALIKTFDLGGKTNLNQEIQIDPLRPTILISTDKMSKGINIVKLILSDGKNYTFKVLVR